MTGPRPGGSVPWPPERVTEDAFDEVDINRLMVFVPAIMSVGLIFSIATLLRDAFHWTGNRARERRTAIEAGAVVSALTGDDDPDPADIGVLSRPTYLVSAIVLVAGAAYVTIGSTANFLRDGGYVRDIGWLLAISLGLAVLLGFLGGVSFIVFVSWPVPPAWTLGPLRTSPLSITPGTEGEGPSWVLTASMAGAGLVAALLTL
ncbi:MAG: hypothetical protein GY773_00625, partial [Actinomycetia bacterium]|nr:hypothetical protein [Actinomycetes bacterium]